MLFSVLELESSTCMLCYVQFVILWSVLSFLVSWSVDWFTGILVLNYTHF